MSLTRQSSCVKKNVSTHEFGERTEVPLWLRKHFGRQGAVEHTRPEKYTDNDFSYVKEDRRQRASRDPGDATPAPRARCSPCRSATRPRWARSCARAA